MLVLITCNNLKNNVMYKLFKHLINMSFSASLNQPRTYLCECFANTAATVKLILKIHLHVSKVSTLTSPIAHVNLSPAWGR